MPADKTADIKSCILFFKELTNGQSLYTSVGSCLNQPDRLSSQLLPFIFFLNLRIFADFDFVYIFTLLCYFSCNLDFSNKSHQPENEQCFLSLGLKRLKDQMNYKFILNFTQFACFSLKSGPHFARSIYHFVPCFILITDLNWRQNRNRRKLFDKDGGAECK